VTSSTPLLDRSAFTPAAHSLLATPELDLLDSQVPAFEA